MAWLQELNGFGDRQNVWYATPSPDEANSHFNTQITAWVEPSTKKFEKIMPDQCIPRIKSSLFSWEAQRIENFLRSCRHKSVLHLDTLKIRPSLGFNVFMRSMSLILYKQPLAKKRVLSPLLPKFNKLGFASFLERAGIHIHCLQTALRIPRAE
jgi:hypothetical protein